MLQVKLDQYVTSNSISAQTQSCKIPNPNERKILIICQGNLALYVKALQEINPKNISVVVCQEEKSALKDSVFSVVHFIKEFFLSGEVEVVCFNILKQTKIDLIVAPSETDILRAAKLRDLFRIQGQSYSSAMCFRDKTLMKNLLKENAIEVPPFKKVVSALDVLDFVETHSFPCIVKPTRGYGSLQTRILLHRDDVFRFIEENQIFNEFHQADVDIEKFIDAPMYHIDGIVREGQIVALWPSKCINTCLGMTQGKSTGGYLLSGENPLVGKLNEYAKKVLKILPTPPDTGFHLELFCDDSRIIFCEIASRIGGPWINDLWIHGMKIDLKNEFIRAQALLPFLSESVKQQPSKLIAGMIFPPRLGEVASIPYHCDLEGIVDYTPFVKVGDVLNQPNGMLGHIVSLTISADTEDQIEKRIKQIETWVAENIKIF